MPIPAEIRKRHYGPAWIRLRIALLRERGHRCEQCGAPGGKSVWAANYQGKRYWRASRFDLWTDCATGQPAPALVEDWRLAVKRLKICITVAHLNHTPGDDRPENLKLLCAGCHLIYDQHFHRATRQGRKDAGRPLLAAEGGTR